MNENARRWVSALRSGEYEQGQTELRKIDNTFCCLGVACDLYAKAHNEEWDVSDSGHYYFHGEGAYLPTDVQRWLGLKGIEGRFTGSLDEYDDLVAHNDRGESFDEIADIIESEPEGMFV